MTGEFPAQKASNAVNVSIWWRHHERCGINELCVWLRALQSPNNAFINTRTFWIASSALKIVPKSIQRNLEGNTPTDKWRNYNVIILSKRRLDVILTSKWRYWRVFPGMPNFVARILNNTLLTLKALIHTWSFDKCAQCQWSLFSGIKEGVFQKCAQCFNEVLFTGIKEHILKNVSLYKFKWNISRGWRLLNLRSHNFPTFDFSDHQHFDHLLKITFIFDRRHRSLAVVTPVKCECNSVCIIRTFEHSKLSQTQILTNGYSVTPITGLQYDYVHR